MKDLHQEHIDITSEVKKAIENLKIVFSSPLWKACTKRRLKYGISNLSLTSFLTREMLDEKIVRHVITLADCADQAINAIETENKTILATVLLETKKLQKETPRTSKNRLRRQPYQKLQSKMVRRYHTGS